MRSETIAIHAGYEPDPATKSVAVPIYQTASYAFDSADHGAALFNLEAEGYRYSRIANPTTAVLEKRVTELEAAIQDYLEHHNADPKPFVWIAAADDILKKVARGRQTLESEH